LFRCKLLEQSICHRHLPCWIYRLWSLCLFNIRWHIFYSTLFILFNHVEHIWFKSIILLLFVKLYKTWYFSITLFAYVTGVILCHFLYFFAILFLHQARTNTWLSENVVFIDWIPDILPRLGQNFIAIW